MRDVDELAGQPWLRLSAESSRNFHSFTHFLHLPPHERSMARAYTQHRTSCKGDTPPKPLHAPNEWTALRFRFNWVERAHAHDADVAARDRLRKIADIEQMQARHASLAVAIQNQIVLRLQHLLASGEVLQMSPVALARLLDVATAVERRARNLPTVITKVENEAIGPLLDLSRLTSNEVAIFESLAERCQPVDPQGGNDGRDE